MRLVPLRPLDPSLLREIVPEDYVRWINRTAGRPRVWEEAYGKALRLRGIDRARPRLKRWGLVPRRLEAYCAYLVLRPIERLLRRRDEARQNGG